MAGLELFYFTVTADYLVEGKLVLQMKPVYKAQTGLVAEEIIDILTLWHL